MAIKCLKLATVTTALVLSTSVNSAVITYGDLSTDNTTDYITDTTTGREYKRFDTFDLSYAATLAAVQPGGIYDGWNIATSVVSDDFINAAFGVAASPCDGAAPYDTQCGTLPGWFDGSFGHSFTTNVDNFWYLSTLDTPNRQEKQLGTVEFSSNGQVSDADDWSSAFYADQFNIQSGAPINALLYRDASAAVVPIPSAVWLFGSGLIGLVGLARRKGNA